MEAALAEDNPSGHVSVARVTRDWYVVCESSELRDRPLSRKLLGSPLVVFRDGEGRAGALLDRCPHRNVPLSLGRVVDGRLECGYHGWQFDRGGRCLAVPGLCTTASSGDKRAVTDYPALEQDGFVWVHGAPRAEGEPRVQPYRLPSLDAPGYTTVRRVVEVEGTLHATVENALDVPHTAFLHRGLFRGAGTTNKIRVVVTRDARSVQAEYLDEPRPEGVVGKLLSPSGGTVTHYDRFIMPCVAQVEYRIGDENHILVTSLCTPIDDFLTRMYAVVTFRSRIPGWVLGPALQPVAMRIFKQDAAILKQQTASIRRFGGERYTSTELDILGPQVWRLLRRAARGLGDGEGEGDDAAAEETGWRRELEIEV